MGAPHITTIGQGTIHAIRQVRVDAASALFALVIPDDGRRARLAVRVWPAVAADGSDTFVVGDKVRYTLLEGSTGELVKAAGLVKLHSDAQGPPALGAPLGDALF